MGRVYLSAPHMGEEEERFVAEAFRTNWLSSVGPHIDAFEREMAERVGRSCVALASGTAAMHLGLRLLGVGPGDEVFVPTLTFAATANPVRYVGAEPVFVDSDRASWNMDPEPARRRPAQPCSEGAPAQGGRGRAPLRADAPTWTRSSRPAPATRYRSSRTPPRRWAPPTRTARLGPSAPLARVLVQRQQDHHHHRRRDAARRRPDPGRARRSSGRPRPAILALSYEHSETRLQLPDEQRPRRHRARAAPGPRRPRAARGAPSRSATATPSPTSRASSSCRRRPAGCTRTGSRSSSSTRHASARAATRSSRPSPRTTSSRARCGSRCTCSRCTRTPSASAARWPRTSSSRGICLPSSSSLRAEEQQRVIDIVRRTAAAGRAATRRTGS